ncbi:MAG: alpha/beta hydrolase [Bauldia sp.]
MPRAAKPDDGNRLRRGRPAGLRFATSPGNPVPAGGELVGVIAADRTTLRAAHWPQRPGRGGGGRGTVCLVPGWAAPLDKYFETVGDLLDRGYAVATLDWRGQGLSERALADPRRLHAIDFAEYDRDYDAFFEQVVLAHCPPPYAVLAHSMGGMLTLRAARRHSGRFSRIALAAPMLGLGIWAEATPLVGLAVRAARTLGLAERGAPLQELFAGDRIPFWLQTTTSDPKRFRRGQTLLRAEPELAVGSTTFGWLNAAMAAIDASRQPDFAPAIGVPVLLAAGGRDKVVSGPAIAAMAKALPNARLLRLPAASHDILVERDDIRATFLAGFDALMAEGDEPSPNV